MIADKEIRCQVCCLRGETAVTFPDDQAVGVLQAVPQLEAQDAKLAEAAVGDRELARLLALQGRSWWL